MKPPIYTNPSTQYRVLSAYDLYEFEAMVSDFVEDGFKTVGSVCVSHPDKNVTLYSQAVLKRKQGILRILFNE